MSTPRNTFTPVSRDPNSILPGDCDTLSGGNPTPGSPGYDLSVQNPEEADCSDFWFDDDDQPVTEGNDELIVIDNAFECDEYGNKTVLGS